MDISGQFDTLGKDLPVHIVQKAWWAPELVRMLCRKEKYLLLPEIKPKYPTLPNHSLVAIPPELSWISALNVCEG
jgi:hypothetical protein